ncbi:heme biosynthesis protein HemY [Rhizobium sp. KVB221]|uniref:Heme biosynthesis protein HemY n=1 Tax=Rhizobium setariae TaxID=2801340 RepID=A0A936YTE9_9HYPH|nr:heme biosynthesis protein HemY [Rhizobium setariae]MBL0374059.1 heme biosynthesis protein HemY [Rhizobium setariae]
MIRILSFIAIVLALGFGFSWLAERPGELSILWQGQRIEMSLMVAATMVAVLVALVMFAWWLVRTIWTSPQSVTRFFRARKRDRGYQALSTGLIAVGSGDAPLARKMLDRTKGLISSDSEPLIHLLEAQTALIDGRTDDARKKFEAMAEDPETRELGLRGLYLEAQRLGAHEAARHYAEKAIEKAPHLPWAAEATLEYRIQAGRYDDAIRLLEAQRVLAGMDRKVHDRKKAVLLTGRALSKLEADPKGAREDAIHALKLAPELVPAASIAAKAYIRESNPRKALSVLEQVWKLDAHPEVASAYVAAGGGSAQEKLKRAERLETLQPETYAALYAVASAAYDARDFALARAKAEAAARIEERESIYLLLADIEETETNDQGRVRYWLTQALRAPRDPQWVADGQISEHWLPISPISGRLDAFEWKRPYAPAAAAIDGQANQADAAFRQLPSPHVSPAEPAPVRQPVTTVEKTTAAGEIKPVVAAKSPTEDRPRVQKAAGADVEPFFGRPPDDPGVKGERPLERTGFRLF